MTMRLLLLLYVKIIQADISGFGNSSCPGPIIDGIHYTDEILVSDCHEPRSLNFDISTNTLYFRCTNRKGLGKFDLYNKQLSFIDLGANFSVSAIGLDRETYDVFVGNDKGIYKYNKSDNSVEMFGAENRRVREIIPKGIVYFMDSDPVNLYAIEDGNIKRVKELKHNSNYIHSFLIDDHDFMVFGTAGGLLGHQKGTPRNEVVVYTTDGMFGFLTLNTYGDVYTCKYNVIYFLDRDNIKVVKVVILENECMSLTLDNKNNFIYSDLDSIHRILPSDDQDCVQ